VSRGPKPDRDFDAQIEEVTVRLVALGHAATHARVALVLSFLRGEKVSRYAVRDRRKRAALRAVREASPLP